jgi:hypothetical protein
MIAVVVLVFLLVGALVVASVGLAKAISATELARYAVFRQAQQTIIYTGTSNGGGGDESSPSYAFAANVSDPVVPVTTSTQIVWGTISSITDDITYDADEGEFALTLPGVYLFNYSGIGQAIPEVHMWWTWIELNGSGTPRYGYNMFTAETMEEDPLAFVNSNSFCLAISEPTTLKCFCSHNGDATETLRPQTTFSIVKISSLVT